MSNFQTIHGVFIYEAIKITVFCLAISGIFVFIGVDQKTLLVLFNIAVMSCAATFSPNKQRLTTILQGSLVIIASLLVGGMMGLYFPVAAKFLLLIYAVLAFLLPSTREQTNIFVTGAVMFLIFTALPFDLYSGIQYGLYSLIILPILLVFYWVFDKKINERKPQNHASPIEARRMSAIIVGIALTVAWPVSIILKQHTALSHLYWIALTILVVVQGAQQKTIKTSLLRIAVNTCGALIIVLLMTYIMPSDYWINFVLLTLFLFLIFSYGYSMILRTLFIELFVLAFTHLLGQYHNAIAFDRVILTLTGGLLVIASTLMAYLLLNRTDLRRA